LSLTSEPDFGAPKFDEKKQYFVDRGGWALGPDGRLYTAPERDSYAIHVFNPDATLERVIERPYQPRKRTAKDIEDIKNGMVVVINGRRVEVEMHIEDHDPAVRQLRVDDKGNLWVLQPQGARELPAGIVRVYDVFDPSGTYVKQVRVACDGDAEADRLLFAGDDRLILVRGAQAALDAMFAGFGEGGGETDEEASEPAPLEVVCYARGS
jgi:sugar lactone lactonase YvrE